jgi:predicted YcjX-like family ATPase
MLAQSYHSWSDDMLARAVKTKRGAWSGEYFAELERLTVQQDDEGILEKLADLWQAYMNLAAADGLVFNQPGRLLRPGTMKYSPVLRLVPLPQNLRKGKLGRKLKARFRDYQKKVVQPFYKKYFASIDRQIVLVDVLSTLERGEDAYNELIDALKLVLQSFQFGKGTLLDWLKGHNTTHVLFAATKADHVTRGDRANLEHFLRKMIRQIDDDNKFRSSVRHYDITEIASVRASEDRMTVKPPRREILYGKPLHADEPGAYDPGGLPLDVPPDWNTLAFQFLRFYPRAMPDAFDEGFPAINLGKALDFLIAEDFS